MEIIPIKRKVEPGVEKDWKAVGGGTPESFDPPADTLDDNAASQEVGTKEGEVVEKKFVIRQPGQLEEELEIVCDYRIKPSDVFRS